jgi:hypothetical protein
MIHGVLARPAAAMTPAPPMQRKTILRSVIAVRAILPRRPAIAVLRLLMLRLGAGNERGQAIDVALVFRARRLRTRLKMLLLLLRLMIVLLLIVLLLARIIWLRLARRERLAADVRLLAVAIVVVLLGSAHLAGLLLLLLVIRLALPELLLRRGDNAEIMLGVLVVIFRRNRIAGALCVTSELKVFFGDVRCGSADFYVRPVGLIHPRQWILVMPTFAVATAHAFVLTVSHGLLFRQPPFTATAPVPPLLSNSPHCIGRPGAARNLSLVFGSRVQSKFTRSINHTSSATARRVPMPFAARANNVRAKPMKRRDPSTI